MKLRQKLAVVLASAMAVTAVPVVTMAASTNSLQKETLKVAKDTVFHEAATANALRIKFNDTDKKQQETFYLELTNAEWNGSDGDVIYKDSDIKMERQSDKVAIVTLIPKSDSQYYSFPLLCKAKGGDATVEVKVLGGTTVSKGSYVFATTAEKKMSLSVGDAKTFYTKGKLADITIDEAYKGSLAKGAKFVIELNDSDYRFASENVTVEYKYGFAGKEEKVTAEIDDKDKGKLTVEIPALEGNTQGQLIIKDIEVESTTKKPEEGDFLVDFKSVDDSLVSEKSDVKVAKISEYGIYIKMKDDKAEDVKAGRREEVEFEIGESVEDSMITARDFEMTLENGHWDYKGLVEKFVKEFDKEHSTEEDYLKAAAKIDSKDLAAELIDNDGDWEDEGVVCEAEFDQDSDGNIIPETIIFTVGKDDEGNQVQDNNACDVLKFKTKICVPVSMKDKEKVTIKIDGRALEEAASTTAINIINPFNVTFEQAVLKTGLQGQVAGSVTLTETDKDCLQKGDVKFRITKDNEEFDIYLTDAEVEVSAGLKGTKTTIKKGRSTTAAAINIDLNRVSKEAATITFKDLTFTTSRTVPEGTYDLEIYGDAIDGDFIGTEDEETVDNHKIVVKDFIKISTANTQDITANGLAKGVASFVIGESTYTLNGEKVTMDAPSYIQDPGYTMVPVRYVANAFGVSASDIVFGKGTATIFAGERTISLTSGSDVALVNGNPIKMATAVVNKEGRMYVPAGQIASLLGIASTWDGATKTATFENK